MIQEYLREIGLSRNEAKIYQVLVELGPSPIGEISSKTKIHRRNVYDSIEKLKEKGFVSWTIRNERKYFEATNPQRIIDIIEEKKEKIKEIIPKLLASQKPSDKQNVRIYTGIESEKRIFDDKLKFKEEQLVLGAHNPSDHISKHLMLYHKKRIARKIPLKMLYPKNETKTAKKFAKLKYMKIRILPLSFNSPIAINVYGNKVAILTGSGKSSPISILIEDKNLSNNFRNYFYALWKISQPL
ncbi:MAG: hypothetical protein J4452_02270 [Candidatus Aenigmarchaeota archaeon]|nr:hypothetical protein [Candidatus Aenigmarchaeota archaeon]